jgi:hypothetical protein
MYLRLAFLMITAINSSIIFFSRFIDEIMNADKIVTDFDIFKFNIIKRKINLLFIEFMISFPNFDLKFKTIKSFKLLNLFIFFIFIK